MMMNVNVTQVLNINSSATKLTHINCDWLPYVHFLSSPRRLMSQLWETKFEPKKKLKKLNPKVSLSAKFLTWTIISVCNCS